MSSQIITCFRRAAETATSIQEVAADIADAIRNGTGRRWVGIYQVTETQVVNLAWSGPAPPAHPTFPADRGLTGAAIHGRAAICSNDVSKDPRYLTNQATTGSELIIPILLGDNVVGTLDIEEAHVDAFTPDDEKLFEAIARELRPLYGNVVT